MRIKLFAQIASALLIVVLPTESIASCKGILLDSVSLYNGPHCLTNKPQRVIALDPSFTLGIGLDVNLPIVGAPLTRMGDDALKTEAETRGVLNLGFVTEPSLERLVSLQPDLIVGFVGSSGIADSIYPMFAQLAPTILETNTKWRPYYQLLSKLSSPERDIDAEFAALDQRIADIKKRLPADLKVSVMRITSWDMQSFAGGPDAYAPFALLSELGVVRSAYEQSAKPGEVLRPDWEDLAKLDGDVLLYIVGGTNDSDKDGRHEEVLNHPLWKLMPAVQAGRVYRIDHGTWMEFNGIKSAHKVLDDVERFILGDRN